MSGHFCNLIVGEETWISNKIPFFFTIFICFLWIWLQILSLCCHKRFYWRCGKKWKKTRAGLKEGGGKGFGNFLSCAIPHNICLWYVVVIFVMLQLILLLWYTWFHLPYFHRVDLSTVCNAIFLKLAIHYNEKGLCVLSMQQHSMWTHFICVQGLLFQGYDIMCLRIVLLYLKVHVFVDLYTDWIFVWNRISVFELP